MKVLLIIGECCAVVESTVDYAVRFTFIYLVGLICPCGPSQKPECPEMSFFCCSEPVLSRHKNLLPVHVRQESA